jgi:DNA-binding transcriptional MerR regulator
MEEESVKNFYQKIGQPRVSRQKVVAGVKTIADLQTQGFSLAEIVWAMTWITSHQEQFGGKVHSLGLLPQVISQALQEREAEKKRETKKRQQSHEEQKLKAEQARRQELEQLYQSLSSAEQAALREVAVEGLLHSGIEKRFLVEPLIRGEVCRLLEERNHSQQ